jgi:hypothetical protein
MRTDDSVQAVRRCSPLARDLKDFSREIPETIVTSFRETRLAPMSLSGIRFAEL